MAQNNETIKARETKTLEIWNYEKQRHTDGQKFQVFNTKTASGKMVEVKFTQECGLPKLRKHFKIECYCNVSEDKKSGRPIIWVRQIVEEIEIENNNTMFDDLMNS